MVDREEAIDFLQSMMESWPKEFFDKMNHFEQGIICVLFHLYYAKEETIAGDLAEKLQVSTARIAIILKKMEQKKYIRKYKSQNDARKTVVEITEEGCKVVDAKKEEAIQKVQIVMGEIEREELEAFMKTLQKIARISMD